MKVQHLIMLVIFGININLQAQLLPIPIDVQLEKAEVIIEGKVIEQKSYFGNDDLIYTANLIEIQQVISETSNTLPPTIHILTRGGTSDGVNHSWSHFLNLNLNDSGLFFLQKSKSPKPDSKNAIPCYEVYSSSQGFYPFENSTKNAVTTIFGEMLSIEKVITPKLKYKTGFTYEPIGEENCIVYSIETDIQGTEIAYSIYANMEYYESALYSTNLRLKYDADILGEFLVSSSGITAESANQLTELDYSLQLVDITKNQLSIKLQSNGKYHPISTQKTLLISGKAKIKNWENIQNFALSSSDVQSTTTLYGKGTFEAACEKVNVNRACPVIDDFTPKIAAAGVGTQSENEIPGVITILGANFDNLDEDEKYHPDEYRVAFTDVPSEGWMYPPQRDYLAWSDTEIRVRVPSLNENGSQGAYAGTGKVAVFKIDEQNCYDTTDVDLYIPFCARNSPISFSGSIQSIKTKMADMDTDGGYEILLEDSYLEIDSAGIVFKRALETWQCQVRVNFKAKLIDDLSDFNFFCPVFLDETLPMGVLSTTLASTNVTPNACLDNTFDHSFLPNFSIRFNKYITDSEGDTISINWHTDTIPLVDSLDILPQNVDLETVALHEIGHGLLLRHTLNDKNVMHKGQLPTRRSLTSDDFNGGDHTVRLSITNPNCQSNMKAFDCSTNAIFELENSKTNYIAFPNPVTDFLTIEYDTFMEGEYNIFEITGKNISNVGSMAGKKHNIDVGNLLKGIYFVSFKEKETGSLLTIKIIKQ